MSGALSAAFESAVLSLILCNANIANLGDATGVRGSSTAGSVYLSLHTATLTGAASQTTSEAAYTNYARVAVARSAGGWTVSGSSPAQAVNAGVATFPACGVTGETETYFAVGRDSSGAGEILWWGPLTSSLAVSNGITPQFAASAAVLTLQ